jgi:selenocysteine lyase/cysteine desulfurase
VDVAAWDVDWIAFSGHKLYAPFGAGVLAGRADWLSSAEPYLAGGGATRVVTRRPDGELSVTWVADEARHEAGSPNVIGAYAIAAACRALSGAGREDLLAHEERLLRLLREGLAANPAVTELSLFGPGAPRVGVVSFTVAGWDSGALAQALADRYAIGVRAGMFCAQPLVRRLLAAADPTADCDGPLAAVRASFGVGTPQEHVTRLVTAVAELTGHA